MASCNDLGPQTIVNLKIAEVWVPQVFDTKPSNLNTGQTRAVNGQVAAPAASNHRGAVSFAVLERLAAAHVAGPLRFLGLHRHLADGQAAGTAEPNPAAVPATAPRLGRRLPIGPGADTRPRQAPDNPNRLRQSAMSPRESDFGV
jgi:hypothetical protein